MIAFLHTSSSHIARFTKIVRQFNSTIEIEHYVKEELLEFAAKNRQLDKEGFDNAVQLIKEKKPDLIICTCSTYGEICDDNTDVKRIDMPIATFIVENFSTIILTYTAASTSQVSRKLLESVATRKDKTIKIVDCDCTSSWQYFLSDNMEIYYKEIFGKVNKIYIKEQVVFLAQASMEGAKKYFEEKNIQVFSSGEFGVRKYLEGM